MRRTVGLVTILIFFGLTGVANATSVVLTFVGAISSGQGITGLGTNELGMCCASPATLTMDIQMTVDSRGVSNAVFSIRFDSDLRNELNILSIQEIAWSNMSMSRNLSPVNPGITSSQESFTGAQEGQAFSFEGVTLGSGPRNTTLTFARIVFATNPVPLWDGPDIFAGLFNPGVDGFFTDGGQDIGSAVFPTATSVTASLGVPEPATFSLFALGIGALTLAAGRRS
jgi:hypothetical protein